MGMAHGQLDAERRPRPGVGPIAVATACGLVAALGASSAAAETPGVSEPARVERDRLDDRPTTPEAEPPDDDAGRVAPSLDDTATPERSWDDDESRVVSIVTGHLGLLALPFADVCPFVNADCEPGETGLEAGIDIFGRWYDFAVGGSFTYGLGLKPSEAAGDPDGTLGREHARTYLLLEGHFRYFFLEMGNWEWFAQASAGGVIINDSWTTFADREPYNGFALVGPQAVTVSTEGVTLGGGIGGIWRITDLWVFGTRFRYINWLLSADRELTPVGDSASLAGRVDVFELGVFGGFRLPM